MTASLGIAAFGAVPVLAQDTIPRRLPPVVVTREKARSPLELPYAISSIRPDSVSPGQPHTMPEQTLFLLPGLTVANRNNPSQDARISIRGFGARSQFGVRSLRVLRDGMPLTMPDGQTPIDYLDLESVGSVETIRGSASSLYGNASGGVIDLRSAAPPSVPLAGQLRMWFGSNAARRDALLVGGTTKFGWYQGNFGATTSDGARNYSRQELRNAFLRAGTEFAGTQFTLIGMGLDMPQARNPGALTRVQYDVDPTQADPLAIAKLARKSVHQAQIGLSMQRPFRGDGEAQMQIYGAGRTLNNPLTFAIVGIDRRTSGASARATLPFRALGLQHRLTTGIDAQRLSDARKNWANCNAVVTPTANCPTLPVERGNRTLDQRETVVSFGPYVRDEIERGRARFTLGVRGDNTEFRVVDHFTSDGRDDSGKRTMSAVSPMAGISVSMSSEQAVYATASTAFETPTTTELANQPTGIAGINPTLDPQRSTTFEVGAKGRAFGRMHYDFAIFATRVRDELIPFDIGSGRVAYQNAGSTRRRGAEGSIGAAVGPVTFNAALTYSDFSFTNFVSGTTQLAGNAIPGIPELQTQFSAAYRHQVGFALMEWVAKDAIWVNDANVVAAPGYALVNVRGGLNEVFGLSWLSPVIGVQNALNRTYVASVAVNAAGTVTTGKFYEPGPGRTWYVGFTAATASW